MDGAAGEVDVLGLVSKVRVRALEAAGPSGGKSLVQHTGVTTVELSSRPEKTLTPPSLTTTSTLWPPVTLEYDSLLSR